MKKIAYLYVERDDNMTIKSDLQATPRQMNIDKSANVDG